MLVFEYFQAISSAGAICSLQSQFSGTLSAKHKYPIYRKKRLDINAASSQAKIPKTRNTPMVAFGFGSRGSINWISVN